MRLDKLESGYNVVEKEPPKNYSIPERSESIGLIDFLMMLDRGRKIRIPVLQVHGLDSILLESENPREVCWTIRDVLWRTRDNIPPGLIVVFPVDAQLRNHNPRLFKDGKDIDLRFLFGNRIEKRAVTRAHSTFNIEPAGVKL